MTEGLQEENLFEDQAIKILVVDDTEANLTAFIDVLTPIGEKILTARSGREALRKVLQNDFACIVLDVLMPDMGGFEVATMIRRNKGKSHIPIIFATAHNDAESEISQGYELGAVDYLIKPVNSQILLSKVQVFVDLHRMSKQLKIQQDLLLKAEKEKEKLLHNEIKSLQLSLKNLIFTEEKQKSSKTKLIERRTPESYKSLLESYGNILESYVDELGFHKTPDKKSIMRHAKELYAYQAGARDVISIHLDTLKIKEAQHPPKRSRYLAKEGRLFVIEIMGELLECYRNKGFKRT